MPRGTASLHLHSVQPQLQQAQRIVLGIANNDESTMEVAIRPESRQGAGWAEQVSVPLPYGAQAVSITVMGAEGPIGSVEHPLANLLASDHEEAALALQSPDGSPAGTVNAVLRLFHGRCKRPQEDTWQIMHRQASRQASLRAQLVQ